MSDPAGLVRYSVPLTSTDPVRISRGYRLTFPVAGNVQGARLTMQGRGVDVQVLTPGTVVDVPFTDVVLSRETDSVTAGSAVVYVSGSPDAWLLSPDASGTPRVTTTTTIGPSAATTQAANSAANAPVAASDGISAAGLAAVKVKVSAAAAQTLSAPAGAELRFWWYSGATARWFLSEEGIFPSRSGVRDYASGDVNVAVPNDADRFYVEVLSWATSGGGALTVQVDGRYQR